MFLDSTNSLLFLSSSANLSASSFAFAISSSERSVAHCITTFCFLPVDFSSALTFNIPFASISNVTSICGCHLLMFGIHSRLNCHNDLLSFANCLSHCTTCTVTAD